MSLFISEIFYSIQGESIHNGRPCVFVRLSGCNLRCSYCDTQYAYENGPEMTIPEIIDKISDYKCRLVEITGGEPLLQNETPNLINTLINNDFEVMLETNGSLDISAIHKCCMKIIDIKCPSSNESDKNDLNNLTHLNMIDQIKFVIGNWEDFEFARDILQVYRPKLPNGHILFSPVLNMLSAAALSQWILEDNLNARLQLQLQKLIWPDKDRGV